jgi:type II restriction/modification system DNA methylase subunit YeeA
MTPQEFIRKWKPVALTERATAHTHFNNLCALVGHDDPVTADPTGESFTFEKGVTKTGGGEGFADVWKKRFFAWEYKKKKRNLDEALVQLVRYAAALENPPLQVACDTDRFLIRTAWTREVPKTYEFALEDLADPKNLNILHSVFFDPDKLRPKETRAGVTKEAADKFSTIASRLQGRGSPYEVAHFVNQLVFCFFAHSVKLLPDGFFPRLLKRCSESPQNARRYFDGLFAAMEKGGDFDLTRIAHFNGGLFDGRRALPLESGDVGLLIAAGSMDWGQIDPTIFGTLFERFLDPEKRDQIGAHYTDPDKIMMIVEPVVLRPLRAEWEATRKEIASLLEAKQAPPMRTTKPIRRMSPREAAEEVRSRYLERLRNIAILDPACGSGNFLYLALQGVKDLELKANLESGALGLEPRVPAVGPEIVHGIEINPLAAELARTTIWIGDIQWGIRNGIYARPEPILRPLDSIECRDALLASDGKDGFVEAEWPEADFIVGNPPFLGGKLLRRGLGDESVDTLFRVYDGRVPAEADLVCYWFAKAWDAVEAGRATRVGLVATNSIRGGANRKVLEPIAERNAIFEAWSDEPWTVDGAAVRVSLVCFGGASGTTQRDGTSVPRVNSDLTASGADLTQTRGLTENVGIAFQGVTKGGPFEVPYKLAHDWLRQPLNPNGQPNSAVIHPIVSGGDIVKGRDFGWVPDFSLYQQEEAALFEAPFEYVIENVRPYRASNRRQLYRTHWWRFAEPRPGLIRRLGSINRYVAIPKVSQYRVFVWMDTVVYPDNLVIAVTRDDNTTFGVLCSKFHVEWSLRLGSTLEDRPTYTPGSCFETFPFPEGLTPDIPASDYADDPRAQRIAAAAKTLDELRRAWLNPPDLVDIVPEVTPTAAPGDAPRRYPDRVIPKNVEAAVKLKERTLTNLYNQRPRWLADAHDTLDRAVAAAYGWPEDIATEEALARLLALNLQRAGAQ